MSNSLISRRDALGMGAAASVALAGRAIPAANPTVADGRVANPGVLQSLGYAVMPGRDLDTWSRWGSSVFALHAADRSSSTLAFRMDDHQYRLVIDRSASVPVFGWQVANAAALDTAAARLEKAGVRVARGSRALVAQRGVRDLVTLEDPMGNRLELFYGPALTGEPLKPGRLISGFRTGDLGMGHVVLAVEPARFEAASSFYQNTLGFQLSDYMAGAINMRFMHINSRHHSLALMESPTGKSGVDHLMMEMLFLDDVGHGYDIAMREHYDEITMTLGRHTNDLMTSFYIQTPSDFRMECGWGGLSIDPDQWRPAELTTGPNIWGHVMSGGRPGGMQGPGGRPGGMPGPGGMPPFTVTPLRAPLQVYGWNFELGHRATALTEVLTTAKAT